MSVRRFVIQAESDIILFPAPCDKLRCLVKAGRIFDQDHLKILFTDPETFHSAKAGGHAAGRRAQSFQGEVRRCTCRESRQCIVQIVHRRQTHPDFA